MAQVSFLAKWVDQITEVSVFKEEKSLWQSAFPTGSNHAQREGIAGRTQLG